MATPDDVLEAIRGGDRDRLQALLDEDPALASARDRAGISAVLHAAYRARTDLLALLLACRPHLGIFEAAALGRTEDAAACLDEDPAAVTAVAGDGFTALHLAAYFARPDVAALLLERGADPSAVASNASRVTPLHSAAAGRSVEVVRLLLRHPVDVNARQHGGWTALHEAALLGDADMVRLLLGRGAATQVASDDGKLPLELALEKGHGEAADLLRVAR